MITRNNCTRNSYKIKILIIIVFYTLLSLTNISIAQNQGSPDILPHPDSNIYEIGSKLIPSSLVKSPREGGSAIVVEKDSQTLWLYTSKDGEFIKVFEVPCSTGEVDGPKMVEGDKKTPEGVYFIKKAYDDRFLTPIYGKRAFTTDYPHFLDIKLGKTGSAIWIHGTNKILKPMDSNGCVAMNNDDVVKLDHYIVLDETPVIITDKADYISLETSVDQRIDITSFLAKWIESLNRGSYLEHLFYYDATNYLPDMRWWAEWVEIRSRSAASKNPITALIDNIGIYKHKTHFVVLFDFQLTSISRKISVGKRKLFISAILNTDNQSADFGNKGYKIIGDLFQTIAIKTRGEDSKSYFITAASQLNSQYRGDKVK
ncbi:MAG: L,D-transpeptidase [Desulfamplus sp.]|nr:L,D-transpeptidase [Desulfamplus sp.]